MLIRNEQIVEMDLERFRRYVDALAEFYRSVSPALVRHLDDQHLRQRITDTVPVARAWGFETPDSIVQFVGIAVAAGPGFVKDPAVQRFFHRSDSSPDLKLRRLVTLVAVTLEAGR